METLFSYYSRSHRLDGRRRICSAGTAECPWQYGQNQQQVQPVQQGQDNHNRQQPGVNQPSNKQQPKDTKKDTKSQKNLKKEAVPKKQTTTKDKTKDIQKVKNTKDTAIPYRQNQNRTYRNYAPGYNR